MTADAQTLLREALALSDRERADLVVELMASLDDPGVDVPEVVSELWAREIETRAHRVLAGDTTGEDWNSLRQRLTDQLDHRCRTSRMSSPCDVFLFKGFPTRSCT